jgi:uncharacterized protein
MTTGTWIPAFAGMMLLAPAFAGVTMHGEGDAASVPGHYLPAMALLEVEVMRLGLDRTSNAYVVILREKDGERLLPIWIGQPEAESIVIEMHQMHRERPLTHDLCKNIITQLGATLMRVSITRIVARTYHAELQLASRDGSVIVDARPSDGIALALRFSAPIFASEDLLTTALLDESETLAELQVDPEFRPMSPEQLKAYLENLRPEDFGKFRL